MTTYPPPPEWHPSPDARELDNSGYGLVEFYSVVINEILGNHIRGKIIIIAEDEEDSGQVIYSGDEGLNNKIGIPLTLTGPKRPLLANHPFRIEFHLGGHISSWGHSFSPNPSDNNNDFISQQVECKGIGKATLTYGIISSAIEAQFKISFIGLGLNQDIYPTHYCGEICIVHDERTTTERSLYNTPLDFNHKSCLLDKGQIPLFRSSIAAPTKKSIHILIDLDTFYDDPSYDERIAFVTYLTAPYYRQIIQPFAFSDRLCLDIFWKVPDIYAGDKALDFAGAPSSPLRDLGYSRKKAAAGLAAEAKIMAAEAELQAIYTAELADEAKKMAEEEKTEEAMELAGRLEKEVARAKAEAKAKKVEWVNANKRATKEAIRVQLRAIRSSSSST